MHLPEIEIDQWPLEAKDIWVRAYNNAIMGLEGPEDEKKAKAHKKAYEELEKNFNKDETGKWVKK